VNSIGVAVLLFIVAAFLALACLVLGGMAKVAGDIRLKLILGGLAALAGSFVIVITAAGVMLL